jgi:hypothetical protein
MEEPAMSFQNIQVNPPTIYERNQFETAILMEKMVLILGMLNFGTTAEKVRARKELKAIEKDLFHCLNKEAFHQAADSLGYTQEELQEIFVA